MDQAARFEKRDGRPKGLPYATQSCLLEAFVTHFLALGKVSDFREGKIRAFTIGGEEIAVVLIGGGFHAFSNICTHRQEYLSNGFIIDGQIICGLHEATYHIATGAVLYGPAFEPLPVYPVRVQGDEVQVGWPEALPQSAIAAVDHEEERAW